MIAKQYTVPLPADYDMGIIRHRVATRGPAFDHFPDIFFKAFLIREKTAGGASGHGSGHAPNNASNNEYAPFYVWPDSEAFWPFIAGDGFRGIIDSFGRPPIRTWQTLDVASRHDIDLSTVRSAERETAPIPVGTDLADWYAREVDANRRALIDDPDLVVSVVAADLERWSLVRFRASTRPPYADDAKDGVDAFEVLRFCAPALAAS